MKTPNPRADEGAPIDVNDPVDQSIDKEGQTDTEQVTRAQEAQDEYDDPSENVLNDPEGIETQGRVEAL